MSEGVKRIHTEEKKQKKRRLLLNFYTQTNKIREEEEQKNANIHKYIDICVQKKEKELSCMNS